MDKIMGERLKQCRISAGYTQQEVADKFQLKYRSSICNYEKGSCGNMTIPMLKKFAEFYGVSTAWLLGWSNLTLEEEKLLRIYRSDDETYRKMFEMILYMYKEEQNAKSEEN